MKRENSLFNQSYHVEYYKKEPVTMRYKLPQLFCTIKLESYAKCLEKGMIIAKSERMFKGIKECAQNLMKVNSINISEAMEKLGITDTVQISILEVLKEESLNSFSRQ